MPEPLTPDLCIVGAGAAGLLIAAGASQMGASVVLVEAGSMGGTALNAGCVPSKALLAAAHAAQAMRNGVPGVTGEVTVDFAAAMRGVRAAVDDLAPNHAAARFEGLGVTVIRGHGRFTDPDTLEADGRAIRARRFVLATGAKPVLPDVPGLIEAPYLTHETIFDLRALPEHLLVLGGGATGVELAQAFRRLGSAVTLVEAARLLPEIDPELVEPVRLALRRDGVTIIEDATVDAVEIEPLRLRCGGQAIAGSHLLVAAGRRPATQGLGLDEAKIAHGPDGIRVDAGLRTTNRRVYAVGDVVGGPQYTHLAAQQASLVMKSALFRLPVRNDTRALPRAVFTSPEVAQVGLDEEAARAAFGRIQVLRWPFAEVDRARIDGARDGLAKVVLDGRGRVVGAGIVGCHAAELIHPWCLAVAGHMKIGRMAAAMVPYPTLSDISKKAAGSWFLPKLFSERAKQIVRLLARLP